MYLYKVGLRYQKEHENGEVKKVTEHFLISAVSFTDAEFRAAEVLPDLLKKAGEVIYMERKQFNQVLQGTEDQVFFEVKTAVVIEEAKIQKGVLLIRGYGMEEALEEVSQNLREEYQSFKIVSAKESNILDFYPLPGDHMDKNRALRIAEGFEALDKIGKETEGGIKITFHNTKEEARKELEAMQAEEPKEPEEKPKRPAPKKAANSKPASKKAAPAKKSARVSK